VSTRQSSPVQPRRIYGLGVGVGGWGWGWGGVSAHCAYVRHTIFSFTIRIHNTRTRLIPYAAKMGGGTETGDSFGSVPHTILETEIDR